MEEECKTFRKHAIDILFSKDTEAMFESGGTLFRGLLCHTPKYQSALRPIKGVTRVLDVFGIKILDRNKTALSKIVDQLESSERVRDREYLEELTNEMIRLFSDSTLKTQIRERLSILKSEEIDRLDEATHCFLEDCNYSTVVMSVSAIEFRLLALMKSVHPDHSLEKMTLGQLIREYLSGKDKYEGAIPKKYEPLLGHCNTFRILSVHPKKEKISKSVATSIFYMTFQFLLDKELTEKVND